jgi:hypothetical protein
MTAETVSLATLPHHAELASGAKTGIEDWLQLIRAEYLEMPGLHLTSRQAQRLWNLDAEFCEVLLELLIADRFLKRTPNGAYARSDDGAH